MLPEVAPKKTRLCTLLSLVVAGCANPSDQDLEAERLALVRTAESFHAAAMARDHDAVVALFAEDAIMLPPNGAQVTGLEAVREYPFGFIENPNVDIVFDLVESDVSSDGRLGWTVALAHITVRGPDGLETRDLVRDLHTWRRQPDQSWKITIDIWNSAPPDGP